MSPIRASTDHKLHIATTDLQPEISQVHMRSPLYPLPSSSSGESPTLSTISRCGAARSPPQPEGLRSSGRRSEEKSVAPKISRRASDQNTHYTSRLIGGGSVHSGREGSTYGGRKEVLTGPSKEEELRLFARHCKQFYFSLEAPEESSRFISTTLAALPPSHRPAYTRVQSSLRSHAHLHHLRLRVTSFHALLASLTADGSLTPGSRMAISSAAAKSERKRRIEGFARKWCSTGTEPFFRGLWAVLRVQSRGDESRGGAGRRRVVWELDDAVFQESGGPEFMQEAVTLLKGVLGFTDQALTTPPRLRRVRTIPRSYSDTLMRPLPAITATSDDTGALINRERASSDPFEDKKAMTDSKRPAPPPPPPRRRSPASVAPSPLEPRPSEAEDRPLLSADVDMEDLDEELDDDDIANEEIELNKPRYRLWIFPAHLDDSEIEVLMSALPRYLSRDRKGKLKDARFPFIHPGRGLKSLESAEEAAWQRVEIGGEEVAKVPKLDVEEQEGAIRKGTGRMWSGMEKRIAGWQGGRWFRFLRWWRRLFGLG